MGEKIFTMHISDEGFVCRIYKNYRAKGKRKTIHLIMGKRLEQASHKRRYPCLVLTSTQMANKHTTRFSKSLLIRKMLIKTTIILLCTHQNG